MNRVSLLGFCLLAVALAPGCRTSLSYGSGDVDPVSWGAKAPRLLGPVDGRAGMQRGAALVFKQPYGPNWEELSSSMREHLTRAGLAPLSAPLPTTPATAQRALEAAKATGAPLAVVRLGNWFHTGSYQNWVGLFFLFGLAPGFATMAIPLHTELADVRVDAVIVDPSTGEVLGTFAVTEHHQDTVSAYTWSPPGEALKAAKRATQKLIEQMAGAARANYPQRTKADDLAAVIQNPVVAPAPAVAPKTGGPATGPQLGKPTAPPPGTPGAKVAFLLHRDELKVGVTTRAQVAALLGTPTLDQRDGKRRQFFYVHSQPEAGNKIVTRMLYVWFRDDDTVDEVKYAQTP